MNEDDFMARSRNYKCSQYWYVFTYHKVLDFLACAELPVQNFKNKRNRDSLKKKTKMKEKTDQ